MDISSWLNDTITVAHCATVDANGDPVVGTQAARPARVEKGSRLLYNANGDEMQCTAVVATEGEIKTTDKVWLPGDDTSDANAGRRPIQVRSAATKDGSYSFWETYL